LAKPNYRHVKKQKEAARKARQDAKQQRRAATTPVNPQTGEVLETSTAQAPVTRED
jgi:hypothetical protein